jgi:hypothetical protein
MKKKNILEREVSSQEGVKMKKERCEKFIDERNT